ncbi:MAG: acyl-CoA dehydrogenase, partial [Sphingobacteriaceae bacterium]|nr:acyl-CoA dehydrogenase [Cytophagaceae bacterium]
MSSPFFSPRNLRFVLHELLRVEELTDYAYFQDHSRETFDLVLDTAARLAETRLRPLLTAMDRQEPQLVNGQIRIHPAMHALIRQFGEDGWINATFRYDEGGQQLPGVIHSAAGFVFQAANYSASVFPFLTTGAANLLRSFGSNELVETFTPPLYSGEWQGTMALTEPDAGSSLSDLRTSAEPTTEPGTYKISGQKIYISAGDHDGAANIVHLMLARIKEGPAGAKGISLFVVPKFRIKREETGDEKQKAGSQNSSTIQNSSGRRTATQQLEDNDVVTAGIYHKMGYKGAPIAHLTMGSRDDCQGYLVGESHQGLRYMFQMMNEARVGVGLNATAIATAAYYASLAYARERSQGRVVSEKRPGPPLRDTPPVPIIRHADVRRMLLFQKSVVEGSLALLLRCAHWADLAHVGEAEERERAGMLLDLLTPVAKSYPSEMGCLSTSAAVQILGGAGYTTDFPVEQYYREARIHPIHEGTTGIHGLDLLGRKIGLHGGKALRYFVAELQATAYDARRHNSLKTFAETLEHTLGTVQRATRHLLELAAQHPERGLADATLYLDAFGILTIAWQWLDLG